MSPVRVQRRRAKGWRTPLCSCGCGQPARYVGRGTRWGNPWRVGDIITVLAPALHGSADGHYKPENCRWADRITQQNNRRNNHRVTWRGQTRTVTEWALILGVRPNTLLYRIRRGWPLERAMTFRVDPVLLSLANPPENGVVQLCG